MKYTAIAIAIFLSLTTITAWACSERIAGNIDHADLERQEALARELAVESEAIAVVEILDIDYQAPSLHVLTNELIKGDLDEKVELTWNHDDRFGCKASVEFHNIRVKEGMEYLVYVHDGKLRRAAQISRSYQTISFDKEIEIIRSAGGDGPTFP